MTEQTPDLREQADRYAALVRNRGAGGTPLRDAWLAGYDEARAEVERLREVADRAWSVAEQRMAERDRAEAEVERLRAELEAGDDRWISLIGNAVALNRGEIDTTEFRRRCDAAPAAGDTESGG